MSIKKAAYSLNMSILLRMIISIGISVLIFILLFNLSDTLAAHQNSNFHQTRKVEINEIVDEIKNEVSKESLTLEQARNIHFVSENSPYSIYLFSSNQNELYNDFENSDAFKFLDDQEVFEIDFSDVSGFIIVNSNDIEFTAVVYYIVSGVIAVFVFFCLSIYLVFDELSYIKTIEKGVEKIAEGDILHKIPVVGKNELARLAKSINFMGSSMHERIIREREDEISQRLLITNLSHDLRTPLTSINGYLDLTKSKLNKNDEIFQYIDTAKENSLRLEKLINDLFLYSKLISGDIPVNFQKMDVNLVLRQIIEIRVEELTTNFTNKNCMTNIDVEKFYRIMDNLLSNAVKYSAPDNITSISTQLIDKNIFIRVTNNTYSDLKDIAQILKKRMYVSPTNNDKNASGLGLSIVSELVKALNGKFQIEYADKIFTAVVKLPKN